MSSGETHTSSREPPSNDEVMTTADVMRFLKINRPETVYSLAQKIPHNRIGRQYRFLKSDIVAFVRAKGPKQPITRSDLRLRRPAFLRDVEPIIKC